MSVSLALQAHHMSKIFLQRAHTGYGLRHSVSPVADRLLVEVIHFVAISVEILV